MSYLLTIFIAAGLVFLETSLLPHFKIFGAVPFLALAFIIGIAVRYRGMFHFLLAFTIGIYIDYISGGVPGLFTGIFVFTVIIGRLMFFRDTGYDASHSFLWLLGISVSVVYLIQFTTLYQAGFNGWQPFLLIYASTMAQTFIAGYLMFSLFNKYFDWLNKKDEERHR